MVSKQTVVTPFINLLVSFVAGWRYIMMFAAALLAGAHFLRAGQTGLMVTSLLLPALLFSHRRWALHIVQLFLVILSIEWIYTAWQIAAMRQMLGEPATRLFIILGIVTAFTLGAAIALRAKTVVDRHSLSAETTVISLGAFILAVSILTAVYLGVSRPMLLLERFFPSWGWLEIFILGIWAAWLGEHMAYSSTAPKWRTRLWTLFSVVFFAQLAIGLAGVERFLQSGVLHLPIPALIVAGPAYRGEGFFMLFLFLATIILIGPAWCSYLCYFGAWDHQAAQVKKPVVISHHITLWRWGILFILVSIAISLRLMGISGFVAVFLALAFGLIGVGLITMWSREKGLMMHCIAWCPIGLLATRLGKINPFRIRITGTLCNSCMTCSLSCRYGALKASDIASRRPGPDCTLCGDCLAHCNKKAIVYHFPGLSSNAARSLFLILVLGLHAAFLGIARI